MARSQHSAPFCGRFLDAELGQKQKQHMIPERSRFSTVEMEGGESFQSFNFEEGETDST